MSRAEPTLAGSAVEKFFQALPDIAPNKKPVTGFLVSLVFGLIGLAVYVRSWFDFLLFIAVIGIIVVAPPSVPDWVLWLLWGVWGFLRVKYSRVRPRNLSSPCNPPRQTVLNNSVEPVIVS